MVYLYKISFFSKMNEKYNYLYIYILILSFLYFILNYLNKKSLLIILILIIISYYIYLNILYQNNIAKKNNTILTNNINSNVKDINQIDTPIYNLNKNIPKNLTFLLKDNILLNICSNINFIKKYNKSLYSNILIHINNFVKIYIYILADKYNPEIYYNNLNDLRLYILEQLYSIIHELPFDKNNSVNLDKLNKNIKLFTFRSRKMLSIIENYSKNEKNIIYLDDTKITPFNRIANEKNILP